MRVLDVEAIILNALQDESAIVAEKELSGVKICVARHPTLGRLVIITPPHGAGIVVEIDESLSI